MGFLQDLTGSSARKDLKRSKAASDAALTSGYNTATGRIGEAYGELTPYAEEGRVASTRYNDLLGLGTQEGRAAGQQTYLDDPMFGKILGQQSNALLRQQNARGGTYGGQAVMAAGRLGLENYNSYLTRIQGQAGQGAQIAGQRSNIKMGQADMDFGFGATKAGSEINFGNAQAAGRSTGINNLLNIAGTAAKMYAASDVRVKRDIERIDTLPSGLPVYEFKYIWSDEPYIGVMAHEVEKFFPKAVAYNEHGFASVDYSRIG